MNWKQEARVVVESFGFAFVLVVLVWAFASCGSLKRMGLVGGGAGVGAAAGSLAGGPAGAIGGAIIGGGVTSAVVEADRSEDSVVRLEDKLAGRPPQPEPLIPPWITGIPWPTWLLALWAWLRRAHLAAAFTGKEPRWDAVLRALGLRTHRTPIPAKRAS